MPWFSSVSRQSPCSFLGSVSGRCSRSCRLQDTRPIAAAATIAVGSSVMLVGFQVLMQPDLRSFANVLPISALGGVLTTGVLFSIFNALFEEVIFRGILFDAIDSQWGASFAVIATSLLFGYGHMHGYPPGPLGAVLAGIYGLCLGWLRLFSGGLGLPVLAHIAADATIFTVVARSGVL